ncbi:hypothetical protein EJ08DRAFT_412612 [Tothia fuscella]|uniref:Uncharacterized protein n=1 Tax=Tothia fuscella TaxID=1048955 RepID=A0A9P4NKG6_9PEZI|nr:hypothetical protein EJ08DRAFT_412612 [Tothia fuscella]
MVYDPSRYQPNQPSHLSLYSNNPSQSHPVHPAYTPSVPRDVPRQDSSAQSGITSQHPGPTPHQSHGHTQQMQYGMTPPMQYGTTPPRHYSVGQIYGTSPSQQSQMYGTTPPHQQYLAPYQPQPSFASQSQAGYPQQGAYSSQQHGRPRGGSVSSQHSHKFHRSSHRHPKHLHYDEKEPRRPSRVKSPPRPSFGDTMVLVWRSLIGAFDRRKE